MSSSNVLFFTFILSILLLFNIFYYNYFILLLSIILLNRHSIFVTFHLKKVTMHYIFHSSTDLPTSPSYTLGQNYLLGCLDSHMSLSLSLSLIYRGHYDVAPPFEARTVSTPMARLPTRLRRVFIRLFDNSSRSVCELTH